MLRSIGDLLEFEHKVDNVQEEGRTLCATFSSLRTIGWPDGNNTTLRNMANPKGIQA